MHFWRRAWYETLRFPFFLVAATAASRTQAFGYTPGEVLHAATALGGEIMGMGHELGQLRQGFLADLLLVDGDPTEDVRILQDKSRLLAIMKDGAFYKAPEQHPGMRLGAGNVLTGGAAAANRFRYR